MLALVVDVAVDEVELGSDALWALGVLAVEERSGGAGRIELWTSLGNDRDVVLAAVADFPDRWHSRFEEVDDAVVDTWREHARPTWIDDELVVWPTWLGEAAGLDGTIVLRIDPGATFGMGDHPTTVLSLQAVRALVSADLAPTVLDVGCGSGVLAIAAARLGADRVDAIDLSPAAEAMTGENARRNSVDHLVHASNTPLQHVTGIYDIVLANILAPVLIELAADLRRVLAPDGTLVVSGILAERHDHVLAALEPLRVVAVRERDGWVAVSLRA